MTDRPFLPGEQRAAARALGLPSVESVFRDEPAFDRQLADAEVREAMERAVRNHIIPFLHRSSAAGWPGLSEIERKGMTDALADLEALVKPTARVIEFPTLSKREPHVHRARPDETCFCTEGA